MRNRAAVFAVFVSLSLVASLAVQACAADKDSDHETENGCSWEADVMCCCPGEGLCVLQSSPGTCSYETYRASILDEIIQAQADLDEYEADLRRSQDLLDKAKAASDDPDAPAAIRVTEQAIDVDNKNIKLTQSKLKSLKLDYTRIQVRLLAEKSKKAKS